MNPKWVNLAASSALTFLAVIISIASMNLFDQMAWNSGFSTIIVATVTAFTVAALIVAAAYNGSRYMERSQRGRRK